MPTWTTVNRVQRGLSDEDQAILADVGITLFDLVRDASAIVETDLEPLYWSFPDVTGADGQTILTPVYVQNIVALKAISLGKMSVGQLSEINPQDDGAQQTYEARYLARVNDLRTNAANIPVVRVTGEAMTFGTDPLGDNEYKYNPQSIGLAGFEVIPESVRVTGYQNGIDFDSRLSVRDRGWLFVRYDSAIVDATTVSYDFTYRKQREKAKAIRFDSTELIPS